MECFGQLFLPVGAHILKKDQFTLMIVRTNVVYMIHHYKQMLNLNFHNAVYNLKKNNILPYHKI